MDRKLALSEPRPNLEPSVPLMYLSRGARRYTRLLAFCGYITGASLLTACGVDISALNKPNVAQIEAVRNTEKQLSSEEIADLADSISTMYQHVRLDAATTEVFDQLRINPDAAKKDFLQISHYTKNNGEAVSEYRFYNSGKEKAEKSPLLGITITRDAEGRVKQEDYRFRIHDHSKALIPQRAKVITNNELNESNNVSSSDLEELTTLREEVFIDENLSRPRIVRNSDNPQSIDEISAYSLSTSRHIDVRYFVFGRNNSDPDEATYHWILMQVIHNSFEPAKPQPQRPSTSPTQKPPVPSAPPFVNA